MPRSIAFLTGRLARRKLERTLATLDAGFAWQVIDIGVKVAALMTTPLVLRRLRLPDGIDRVVVPGRARLDLAALQAEFGVPFEAGPDELVDLPGHFGKAGVPLDLTRHDVRLFAEIVDAPQLDVAGIVARAGRLAAAGADVIDLGCLPETPFPHLADAVAALKAEGFRVSVDTADEDELRRGAAAGADFLLSLRPSTLHLARESDAVPVLVPETPGDLASLLAAIDELDKAGKPCLADPVLDPIHFGFTRSLLRYARLRELRPDAEIMMGTGNLTELTGADSGGVTAVLMGIVSELAIRNVLTVQVSPHTRRTLEEHDAARRMMFAAREDGHYPKGYGEALIGLHDRKPFTVSPEEIAASAAQVRDAGFRIETAQDGVHIYNRDGHRVSARDVFELFPGLDVADDGAHAFYLGAELARAEIAFRLGKRYAQDSPLDWGVAVERRDEDRTRLQSAGYTLKARKARNGGRGNAGNS